MAVDHFLELVFPSLVAALCQPRCGKQLVGDAAKGADDDYNLLMFGFPLDNALQAENGLYGTNGCSAEFQYFHYVLI